LILKATASLKEFNLLTPNNTIYKLIGTALVKQDHTEAKANVKKRLEFIQNEMYGRLSIVI
jgi:prefoldin beta subunit